MSTCSFSCSTRNFTGNRKKDKRATDNDLNHKTHFEGCRKPRPEPSWLRYTFPTALLLCAYANLCALFFIMQIKICALFLIEHSIVRLKPAHHRSVLESFSYCLCNCSKVRGLRFICFALNIMNILCMGFDSL